MYHPDRDGEPDIHAKNAHPAGKDSKPAKIVSFSVSDPEEVLWITAVSAHMEALAGMRYPNALWTAHN